MTIFNKLFGQTNEKELDKINSLVERINQLEPQFESFSDEEIKKKTEEFKKEIKEGKSLDDILPEAFALAREASKRSLGQRHFDVQLIGGITLHQGKIAEMKTGEGKTLAATLPIYLNALEGKGVHAITVNDYLSRRDANWMGPVYHSLGLTCACLNHEKAYLFNPETKPDGEEVSVEMENLKETSRKEAYQADVLYGTNNEFGFDYLRDNMAPALDSMAQRNHRFAIVDEIDSILIDEARTPLIISMPDAESTKMYQQFSDIAPQLKENTDYNLEEKSKAVTLTEEGISKVEKILGMENIYEEGGIRYVHHLEQALRAKVIFKKDRDYVVKDGQVMIVDEFTGRLMPGRRYSNGLHQALEAKEKVTVQQESRTLASITFQNYFRMYSKLAGMTGTALTSAEEFSKVYGLEVVAIPTNKEKIRKDLPDGVYKGGNGKFKAIAKEVKERNQKGQPVLIGTVSIEKNELLSKYLQKEGVPHQVLNAKNHEQEAKIISQAGKKGTVTVATNMAGRGVDIVLGEGVTDLGGLHVIGTERHEARRIDNQLRGRAGRQGDPGSSQFFVSLEDDLMRVFGGDRIKSLMETMKVPEDQPIENKLVSKAIESAQSKIEGYNFDVRNHVLEYDDVLNKQREIIYKKRKEILKKDDLQKEMIEMIKKTIRNVPTQDQDPDSEDIVKKEKEAMEAYHKKEKEFEEKNMRQVEKFVMIRSLDMLWMDHLDNMDHLRDSVRLRAYGQKDPLIEYKNEGMKLFQQLLSSIQATAVNMIFNVGLAPKEEQQQEYKPSEKKNIGRNDPCHCGSGKKFKKCCGK